MTLLFVYGTLQPGEVRWQHLAPFVVGEGREAFVAGELYDTGLDYPAAIFGGDAHIHGRVYPLDDGQLTDALAHLDEVEGAVRGLYERVSVVTGEGEHAWAYQCGEQALLRTRIESGDWLRRH
ncbi:MAG TPA: gamma-glutamylcyclotransferase [Ilumatobacteraceae bacterium]|nr:gamma-glutamylcyclotransferase [Ilumatobacteraceae bacterium]HRB02358.1 gamma-glutamylcyclotransferase [Ilumatobacteraceae bacterium]